MKSVSYFLTREFSVGLPPQLAARIVPVTSASFVAPPPALLARAAVRGRGHDGLAPTALRSWPHELRGRRRRRLLPGLYPRYVCRGDSRRRDGPRVCGYRSAPRPPSVSWWAQRAQLLASGASTSAGRGSRPCTTLKPVVLPTA